MYFKNEKNVQRVSVCVYEREQMPSCNHLCYVHSHLFKIDIYICVIYIYIMIVYA